MRLLRDGPRWIFLATLIYAPWAYGCTGPRSIEILNWVLFVTLLTWIASLILMRRRPFVLIPVLVVAALILTLGWGMVANACAAYDPEFESFVSLRRWILAAPGSIDVMASAALLVRATLVLGTIMFVVDLAQRPVWLLRIWYAIGIAGASIALFGLIEKAAGARTIFWQNGPLAPANTFFATYFYHANAGAFLNLILPPVAGLAMRAVLQGKPVPRAIWLCSLVLVLVAIVSNTSRAAQLVSLVVLCALLIGLGPRAVRAVSGIEKRWLLAGAAVFLVALISIAQATRLDQPLKRWGAASEQLQKDARWSAARAAWPAATGAGVLGFGPGTFRAIFPQYALTAAQNPGEGWHFLHEDYIETIVEWGWLGAGLWGFLLFGGIVRGFRNWRERSGEWRSRQRMLLVLVLLSLTSIALHAFVDFPFQIASLQLYVATYLGICWGSAGWNAAEKIRA
jgi:hypothetical protein